MGMVLIGMSLGSAFGFCFYIGLWFGELHSSLPFLLLGIGVDDMYVIVQGISNLSDSDKKLPIPDRIGIAMKHAGVSITVTSVTDMAAFLIGSSSVSFSVYLICNKKIELSFSFICVFTRLSWPSYKINISHDSMEV